MIITLKKDIDGQQKQRLMQKIASCGLKAESSVTNGKVVLSLSGNTYAVDTEILRAFSIVESVKRIEDPFKLASKSFNPCGTEVSVNDVKIGKGNFCLIAGPCAIESERQIVDIAEKIKDAGANLLRGGAFKPRTSPYSFQGLGKEGIRLLLKAKAETGMPVVSEITCASQEDLFYDIDVVQIGARNMQNYELIKKVGQMKKPVLLKRGISATVEEWLLSAEYLLTEGTTDVILCERGIRTFEPTSRYTLDLSSVPVLKERTHLPVIADPSHASGNARFIEPLSLAAAAVGADGLMIEVHSQPEEALSDGAQAITPEALKLLCQKVKYILDANKKF